MKLKSGKFLKSSWYVRGGKLRDKWGNTKTVPISLRNNHTGAVVGSQGKVLGQERNLHHNYAFDPRAKRGLRGFSNDRQRKAVMARLRGR